MKASDLLIARLNGGRITHLIERYSNRALCGREPGGSTRMGKVRSRWLKFIRRDRMIPTCEKCANIFRETFYDANA